MEWRNSFLQLLLLPTMMPLQLLQLVYILSVIFSYNKDLFIHKEGHLNIKKKIELKCYLFILGTCLWG